MLTGEHDTLTWEAVQHLQHHHQLLALGITPENATYPPLVAQAIPESEADVDQNGRAGAPHTALKMEDPVDGPAEQGTTQPRID
jgi:hypothetical protein